MKSTGDKKVYAYDAEHERKRKEQLTKLFDRTPKQIEEEQMLVNELKKIEARKKERDRKTQDLQKLISQADQVHCTKCFHSLAVFNKFYLQQGDPAPNPPSNRKQDKKLNKKKLQNQIRPSRVDSMVNVCCSTCVVGKFKLLKLKILKFFSWKVLESNSMTFVALVCLYDLSA